MDKNIPDFYLASSDGYYMDEPRKCYQIKRLQGDKRKDYMLINVDPPFIGQNYGLGGQDFNTVLIATRHKGDSLFPINKWPVFIHVARLLINNPEDRDIIHDDEMQEIGWAELYRSELDAIAKKL